ncbi:excinuclease ABC, A subunit [Lishizhenia tianjinensis]|uniref:UvrABC system protein A n=1 Tax=Lishizhenia tianjinensis TaxID=477690 RepID=A0A1I7A1N9_9FLAO|nr:ATP-binding cassette domain-containing protein [Lishizhenia tianjinensis]SFT68824.1 excinuclease ABC, A subunit [Lishizhenia tianjinensis]
MRIEKARQNNLKNVSLTLPEKQLIVVTGLSGSGKSSLAMGVIGNEGYRYFLESLPAYNQQNAQRIPSADVDEIKDLPPVIKVEQSKRFQSINATFGTLSELTPLFRILFARYAGEGSMSKSLFSFNHPKGACETCRGIGEAEYIDLKKLVGDPNKTLREGAIVTTLPNGYITYSQVTVDELNKVCNAHGFSVDVPWKDLTAEQQDVIPNGSDKLKVFYGKHSLESRLRWEGLKAKPREEGYYKGMLPIMYDILKRDRNANILKFVSAKECPSCRGARIKAEHLKYRWQGLSFREWMDLPLNELYKQLKGLSLKGGEAVLVNKLCTQLYDLIHLGMEHYQLSSPSTAISSGDAQRMKLVKQVNSNLQGILYVFDEPSIGLPVAYQKHLRLIIDRLLAKGNTVMVVEHDLKFIQSADWIVELGPKAGGEGGEIIFNGSKDEFLVDNKLNSPTRLALEEKLKPSNPVKQDEGLKKLQGSLSVYSRKSKEVLGFIDQFTERKGYNTHTVSDQPIGKTPRSNPATYTGLADKIRDLLAKTEKAKQMKLAKGAFSFNNKAGRCPNCEGAGVISLSMSVMGNINQTCPLCNGKRFNKEVFEVTWEGKNSAEIYNLSVKEALDFFATESKIVSILQLMNKLGLGYLKLGQPSNTLSGGEAQRIKLTKYFAKSSKQTLLILEEPSIGLHHQNVKELVQALHQLKAKTAGIVCFENHSLFQSEADVFVDNAPKVEEEEIEIPVKEPQNEILIQGARTHFLKDVNISFPKHKLSAVTGISGSGKSSLLIDTLHAYGMQEMTQQFSSYEQGRVGAQMPFDVDHIQGLTPTICVTRKVKNYSAKTDLAQQCDIDKRLRFVFSRKAQFEGEDLSASHFSKNHELGKCEVCDGYGEALVPDLNKIVLDANLSIAEGVFEHNKSLAYYGQAAGQYMAILEEVGKAFGFSLTTAFKDLTTAQKKVVLNGVPDQIWEAQWRFKTKTREGVQSVKMEWKGLFTYLQEEYYKTRKNKNISQLTALFSEETCATCKGSGLKAERLKFTLGALNFQEVKQLSLKEFEHWLSVKEEVSEIDNQLKKQLAHHLKGLLKKAKQLHIDYLQLNRKAKTLSGGEHQRVALIQQLNSPLKGITYVLDEPSAGLSQNNIGDVQNILNELVAKGNTVIFIEHNKDLLKAADYLVEIGPKAGSLGGELMFSGSPERFIQQDGIHPYLKAEGKELQLRAGKEKLVLKNIDKFNLKKEVLEIPVGGLTALTGNSGVGKTTLVKEVILPSIAQGEAVHCSACITPKSYEGVQYFETKKLNTHKATLLVEYLDVFKEITKVFAKVSGEKAKFFSWKTKGSFCENCKGEGIITTSLDLAASTAETCEKCKGTRYADEVLKPKVEGQNIAEVMALNVEGMINWLQGQSPKAKVISSLQELQNIGLGHLQMNQAVQSLSSGEKQRLTLLDWRKDKVQNQLLILDEPSIGLHYSDIDQLLTLLKDLSQNNDVLVIDHNAYLLEQIGVGAVIY